MNRKNSLKLDFIEILSRSRQKNPSKGGWAGAYPTITFEVRDFHPIDSAHAGHARMRGTTVPRKKQNKAFEEEIGQPGGAYYSPMVEKPSSTFKVSWS